jgi:putative peptidoglycan lipid II flippase
LSSLTRATAVMSVGTALSRLTGLVRLVSVTAALGIVESGRLTDTYNIGNTAPNIIYELVLGGVLTSVFVPVFVELLEREGRDRAWEVASALINLSVVVLTAITTIVILAAPWISGAIATRAGAAADLQRATLTFLLRLCIPQIIFYGMYAVTSGLLNAHKRFGAPMYTPILNNLAVIAVFVGFHQAYGRIEGGLASVTSTQLWIIGAGTTSGVVLQALAQLPLLRGLGRYRPAISVRDPSILKLARLSVFVIGYVIVNQIGYAVVLWLANGQRGGYSAYVAAFTFYMLPHGLFSVSVITALLPGMSGQAVNQRWVEFRSLLATGIRATSFLVLPAAVGYFVLAGPIIAVLLEHGVVSRESVDLVAGVLRFFVVGLVPFSLFQLLLRAFYALQDTKTPFFVNCAAVGVNIAVDIALFAVLRVQGLAAGHAISYMVGATLLARALARRVGGLGGMPLARDIGRIGAAAAGMGIVVWLVSRSLAGMVGQTGAGAQIVVLAVSIATGVVAYTGIAALLGVEELGYVRQLVVRRRPPPP